MRGYYEMRPWIGAGRTSSPPSSPLPSSPLPPSSPSPSLPQRSAQSNERGKYGSSLSRPEQAPWTEAQRQAFQSSLAMSAIGSVAGAVLWKDHRVWGFILGGMGGGAVGRIAFRPPTDYP